MKLLKNTILFLLAVISIQSFAQNNTVELQKLDFSNVHTGWKSVSKNTNIMDEPLSINKVKFEKGIGIHAYCEIKIALHGNGTRFSALVGVDDHVAKQNKASIIFLVIADNDTLYNSGLMRANQHAKAIDVSLIGVKLLTLVTHDGSNGTNQDHGDWVNAKIEYAGETIPSVFFPEKEPFKILTPPTSELPRINGAKASAARPGSPYLFRVPVTGLKPLTIKVKNLPKGLKFNPKTRLITGKVSQKGEYEISITVSNSKGSVSGKHKIVIGDKLSLTPPMGWNSWNAWGMSVSEDKVREAIDFMVSSGLADHGWTYVNIDDGWQADARLADGTLLWNDKFKDIKKLAYYAHSKGIKLGIYSSPGKLTCGGKISSYQFEAKDAQTWGDWGVDYLKYDWCSYSQILPNTTREEYMKPYIIMHEELKKQNNDIVFSFCQYGLDNVWEWGTKAGGQLWRTTEDIIDTWSSMSRIGFDAQANLGIYADPGAWNDPDMMVVGHLGWSAKVHPTRLSNNEQYTHVTQWAMLAAPLLIGCDMSQLDEFTLNLLTNDEVIEINQDMLGKQAQLMYKAGNIQVWKKELSTNQQAIAIYNLGDEAIEISIPFDKIGLKSMTYLRDVWQQKDLGKFSNEYLVKLPRHGCQLITVKQF